MDRVSVCSIQLNAWGDDLRFCRPRNNTASLGNSSIAVFAYVHSSILTWRGTHPEMGTISSASFGAARRVIIGECRYPTPLVLRPNAPGFLLCSCDDLSRAISQRPSRFATPD